MNPFSVWLVQAEITTTENRCLRPYKPPRRAIGAGGLV